MTTTSDGATRRPQRGHAYTRNEIYAMLGGSKRACLPTKDGVVVAACLLKSFNPDAPLVVLCGTGPRNGAMGDVLAMQRTSLPVFIKQAVGRWICEGWFTVDGSLRSGARFATYVARSSRAPSSVSRVVILKRLRSAG